MIKVLSIFSGCGGFDLGLIRAGAGGQVIGAYDVSEAACRNYERIMPGHQVTQADLTRLNPRFLPDADMIIGGPPCQAFSEGNADRPGEGSVLNLWPTTLNIVKVKRPARFLFENVRGLVKDHPAYFWSLLNDFRLMGYNVDWKLLNAADYGVPQTRHRVFIAGWRPGLMTWQWPEPTHHNRPYQETLWGDAKRPWVSWDVALSDWLREEHERCDLPPWIMKKVGREMGGGSGKGRVGRPLPGSGHLERYENLATSRQTSFHGNYRTAKREPGQSAGGTNDGELP